jgi:hypothetical protein
MERMVNSSELRKAVYYPTSHKKVKVKVKVKVKSSLCLTKHHAMKTYWGVEVWLHEFFDLGTRCRCVVPSNGYWGKSTYPLDRRLGGPQSRCGNGIEKKNTQPPPAPNPDHPIVQPVA